MSVPKGGQKRPNPVNVCPQKVAFSLLLQPHQGWLFKSKNWLMSKIHSLSDLFWLFMFMVWRQTYDNQPSQVAILK